jgi:hypothetical protein
MPGSDASQFTRFKRANAIQKGDTQASDTKSVNRLTQYTPHLSAASNSVKFLSSLTAKSTTPLFLPPPLSLPPPLVSTPMLVKFTREDLDVGVNTSGVLTQDYSDSTSLDPGKNYVLYRVNVDANKTYSFKLTANRSINPYTNAYLIMREQDSEIDSEFLSVLAGFWYAISTDIPGNYFGDFTQDNPKTLEFRATTSGFFDVGILSWVKGGWSFKVSIV